MGGGSGRGAGGQGRMRRFVGGVRLRQMIDVPCGSAYNCGNGEKCCIICDQLKKCYTLWELHGNNAIYNQCKYLNMGSYCGDTHKWCKEHEGEL